MVIAHRLSPCSRADVILVMHMASSARWAPTRNLLATQRGIYWKLYQLQYKDQEVGEAAAGLTPSLAMD